MIYTPANVHDRGAQVYDMRTLAPIEKVLSIDTEKGELVQVEQPIRVVGDDVATVTRRFSRIEVTVHPRTGGLMSARCHDEVEPSPSAQTVPDLAEGGRGVG